jgi:STE24 endopeptidase
MNALSYVFLATLAAGLLLQHWLLSRHRRHVAEHRNHVPSAFAASISPEAHRKAADYTVAKVGLSRVGLNLNALVLLVWTLGGGLALLDSLWQQSGLTPLWAGIGLVISVFLISTLLDAPLSLWSTFVLEAKFGFNRTTLTRYLVDLLLQLVLMLALGIPLVWALLWIMGEVGSLWWLAAWVVWMSFTLLMTWAYPTLIAPLFNRFEPMRDRALRTRIERLLERCGFRSGGIFIMDGSRRSTHGNAYFTGLGAKKQIVFFDTLLDTLEPDEVEAVLAHELGHFRYRHLLKRLMTMGLLSIAGLALLGWLAEQPWFYTGLGVTRESDALALVLFLLVSPVVIQFFAPLGALLSRWHEREADDYAATQTRAEWLISALVKLYRDNASTLTPDPLYSAFHDSHPSAPARVAHLAARVRQRYP